MSRPMPSREQLPAVQRLRVRFAKRGRLRFTSHRDFQRAFERALRRAAVPMAYSQGFTPHPKVSYAGASPTGAASEAEYLEISVTRRCVAHEVRAALDAAMPPGLDIVDVVEAGREVLTDRLQASVWQIGMPGADASEADAALQAFLAAESVPVERRTKKGARVLDARAATLSGDVVGADPPTLRLTVRHQSPTVRPEEVLKGLELTSGFVPPEPARVVRLAQGIWAGSGHELDDPFRPDRAGDGAAAVSAEPPDRT